MNALCLGCFREKGDAAVCPYCGYSDNTPQHSALCLPAGSVLNGRYLVGKTLGQGGFGITYLGFDLNSGTKVAIKEFLPDGMATRNTGNTQVSIYSQDNSDDFRYGMNKFLEEARILARFSDNPHIVKVYSFFLENETAYFAMEYIDGMTLKDYLKSKNGKLEYNETLNILTPVMLALEGVHKEHLLHRDVSPDNIYISMGGTVKLLDFGAARYNLGEHSKSLSVILKPGFAPEEQYRSRGNQGPWTDIYALAATIYLCLTGTVPPVSLDRIQTDELVLPSKMGVAMPQGAETVLMKALAVKAEYRFTNVIDFKNALYNPQAFLSQRQPVQTSYQPQAAPAPGMQIAYHTGTAAAQGQPAYYQSAQGALAGYQPYMQGNAPVKTKNKSAAIIIAIAASLAVIVLIIGIGMHFSNLSHTGNVAQVNTNSFHFGTTGSNNFENSWSNIKLELPSTWSYFSLSQMKKTFNGSNSYFSDCKDVSGKKVLYDFCAVNSDNTSTITLLYDNLVASNDTSQTPQEYLDDVFSASRSFKKYGDQQTMTIGGYTYYDQQGIDKEDSDHQVIYCARNKGNYMVILVLETTDVDNSTEIGNVIKDIEQVS